MDAADDPGDAQLFWSKSSRFSPSIRQRPTDVPSTKVIFDIFEPVAADSTLENVPDKVQSFDLAHSDEDKAVDFEPTHLPENVPDKVPSFDLAHSDDDKTDDFQLDLKQFQDDLITPGDARPLWADVSDGDVEHESLSDVSAEEATAEFRSQEHQKTREPITSTAQAHVDFREFAKATLPDVFPASDAESGPDDEALEEEALLDAVDLPTPCTAAADAPPAVASQFVISLADALGLPEVAGDDDSKQGDRVVDGGPLPLRLPTVTGLQSSLEQLVDVSIGPNRASPSTRMHFLEKYAAATRQFELEFDLGQKGITLDDSGTLLQAPDDVHARHSGVPLQSEPDASRGSISDLGCPVKRPDPSIRCASCFCPLFPPTPRTCGSCDLLICDDEGCYPLPCRFCRGLLRQFCGYCLIQHTINVHTEDGDVECTVCDPESADVQPVDDRHPKEQQVQHAPLAFAAGARSSNEPVQTMHTMSGPLPQQTLQAPHPEQAQQTPLVLAHSEFGPSQQQLAQVSSHARAKPRAHKLRRGRRN